MEDIFIIIYRTVVIYLVVTIGMRCMGKRQIGEMSTAEISVTLLISEIASTPVTTLDVPLYYGVAVVVILVLCEIIMSYLDLKFSKVVRITQGQPTVLVKQGRIIESEMRKSRVTIAELNEELRQKNISISDVYIAIIETTGLISIIPTASASPATKEDLKNQNEKDPIDFAVVIDGELKEENLKLIGQNEEFVHSILRAKNIKSLKDIFVMYADTKGMTYLQLKENK